MDKNVLDVYNNLKKQVVEADKVGEKINFIDKNIQHTKNMIECLKNRNSNTIGIMLHYNNGNEKHTLVIDKPIIDGLIYGLKKTIKLYNIEKEYLQQKFNKIVVSN